MVPINAYGHANVGRITAELAREKQALPHEAFAAFERALALDPNNAYICADATRAALALGEVKRATEIADAGLQRYPNFGPLNAVAGYVAMQEGRLEAALSALLTAMPTDWHEDENGRHSTWNAITLTLIRMKRFDEAATHAWGMIQRWPERPDVYFARARALELARRIPEALDVYRTIVHLWPENRQALAALQRLTNAENPRAAARGFSVTSDSSAHR
jgi:tetratricopeptide (TPR) repeat protein